MTKITIEQYRETIASRFGGVLRSGAHQPDGQACALEAYAVATGAQWTDDPATLGMPDVRRLNDARWSSDAVRTEALIPVVIALVGWSEWSRVQRQAWCENVVRRTAHEIVAELPRIPAAHRKAIKAARTMKEIRKACRAAAYAAYAAANAAANADSDANADAAAYAAADADADSDANAAAAAYAAADAAAYAAAAAAYAAAAAAAYAAANAAAYAAAAAAYAADFDADNTLRLACRIWIEEAGRATVPTPVGE